MKVRFSELPVGSCFRGPRKKVGKKTDAGKAATVGRGGRVSVRDIKGDPQVEPEACPLRYLGVGLRRHPDQVVEIGDGNPLRRRPGE